MSKVIQMNVTHISWVKVYCYKGVTFEWHDYHGPNPLRRKDEGLLKNSSMSGRKWALISKFSTLSDSDKEKYKV